MFRAMTWRNFACKHGVAGMGKAPMQQREQQDPRRDAPGWVREARRHALAATSGVLRSLQRSGVTPNALSWFSLVPAIACAIAAAQGAFLSAALLLALSGVCDFLDGALARHSGQTTRYGALLDSTLDRFADAAPLLGFALFLPGNWAMLPLAALLFGFGISYVRARAEGLGIALPWLWMRRTERLVLTGLALLAAALFPPIALTILVILAVGSGLALLHALHAARVGGA